MIDPQAVVNGMVQKCVYCKHFGASVRCKASGRFYHFPCASASGSFLQKSTLTLIGMDSLDKVASLGKRLFVNDVTQNRDFLTPSVILNLLFYLDL